MLYWILRIITLFLFKPFFNMKVSGREHIPKSGPVIIASNHLSYLDPVVLTIGSPRRLNFMARRSLFRNKVFGKFLQSVGVFALQSETGSDIWGIKEALRRLDGGIALIVFPEGTRSPDGTLKKGLAGVGLIAIKAHCPIVPVFIKGTDKALPLGAKFIRFKPISIHFGKVITPGESSDKEAYQQLSDRIMDRIAKLGEFYK